MRGREQNTNAMIGAISFVELLLIAGGTIVLVSLWNFLPTGPIKKYFRGSPNVKSETNRQKSIIHAQNSEIGQISEAFNDTMEKIEIKKYFYKKLKNSIDYIISRMIGISFNTKMYFEFI